MIRAPNHPASKGKFTADFAEALDFYRTLIGLTSPQLSADIEATVRFRRHARVQLFSMTACMHAALFCAPQGSLARCLLLPSSAVAPNQISLRSTVCCLGWTVVCRLKGSTSLQSSLASLHNQLLPLALALPWRQQPRCCRTMSPSVRWRGVHAARPTPAPHRGLNPPATPCRETSLPSWAIQSALKTTGTTHGFHSTARPTAGSGRALRGREAAALSTRSCTATWATTALIGYGKRLFWSLLMLKTNICQDRLGTNIGKVEKRVVFSAGGWV
eukprot:COSAG06_NODE_382_length_16566_cov_8.629137_11_plen_273_part_00